MAPWLQNLALYETENQQSISKTRQVIRSLIDLTLKETEVNSF